MEAGEFGELFLREAAGGSQRADAVAECVDEGLIRHWGSTIRIVCRAIYIQCVSVEEV
jgi:hypothetical protein